LASTPGVGITLDDLFAPSSALLAALTPISSKWVEKEKPAFVIEGQDPFTVALTTFDGFHYGLNQRQIYVEFRHRVKLEPQSAGPPIAVMVSKPMPFTRLLPEVQERLVEAAGLVVGGTERLLHRVGVVCSTTVLEEEAPPGIVRFLDYIQQPWGVTADAYAIDVTSKLPIKDKKKSGILDRCQHAVSKQEFGDGLVNIKLDWQRRFDPPLKLSVKLLGDILDEAQEDALDYFEDVGQGDRFDAAILSAPAARPA